MARNTLVKGAVLLLLMALGAWIVTTGVWHGIVVERVKRWPQADGVILESKIDHRNGVYWPEVLYEYHVSGKTYRSDRVSILNPSIDQSEWVAQTVQAWEKRYSVGAHVDVLYDPQDPTRAYLENDDHGSTIFTILFGAFLLLVPGAVLMIRSAATYGDRILAFFFVARLKKAHAEMQEAAVELQAIDQKLGQAALDYADAVAGQIQGMERRACEESAMPPDVESSSSESEESVIQTAEDVANSVADPFERPAGSDIVCEEQPGGLTFRVPARGVLVAGCGPLFLGIGFCLMAAIMTLIGYHNGIQIVSGPAAFLAVFWLAGTGMLYWAFTLGRRQTAIAVTVERLAILQIGLFRQKEYKWSREQIHFIDVRDANFDLIEEHHQVQWELQILPRDGRWVGFLCERTELELRWIATRLRHVLEILATMSTASDEGTLSVPVDKSADRPFAADTHAMLAPADEPPHSYLELTGGSQWQPGVQVDFSHPPVSRRFLCGTVGTVAVLGTVLAVGLYDGKPPNALPVSVLLVTALAGAAIVFYLDGLHPPRALTFRWTNRQLTVNTRGRDTSYPLAELQRLVLRYGTYYAQLDAEFLSHSVMLFDSDNRFRRRAGGLPLEKLDCLARELATALGVGLDRSTPRMEPIRATEICRNSSIATRSAVLSLLALVLFGALASPLFKPAAVLVLCAAVLAVPVLGVWVDVTLVNHGRKLLANTVGFSLVFAGGGAFFAFASDYWDTVPGGAIIGPVGTYGSAILAMFGLGMANRWMPRNHGD
jgi:hypothetical protein